MILFLLVSLLTQANAEIFIPMGPSAYPKKSCNQTDLFEAINIPGASCVAQAIKSMDINEVDSNGNTPLHHAIYKKNGGAILFLIKSGSDLNQKNFQQFTPRELAENLGYRKVSEYLSKVELETERLEQAVDFNDLAAAKHSLAKGASIGSRNLRKDTLLHRAAQSGLVEMGLLLLNSGADLEAKNYLGETPLHAAALRGFKGFMNALLQAGANPNVLNFRRETPLDLAVARSGPGTLALLKKYSAHGGSRADVSLEVSGSDGAGDNKE